LSDKNQPDPDVTPIEPRIVKGELDDYSHEIAGVISGALPDDVNFALFIYKDDGSTKFIGDGELADVDVVVDRWKRKVFGGDLAQDPSWNAAAEVRRLRMYLVNVEIPDCPDDPSSIVSAAINRLREMRRLVVSAVTGPGASP
jgi:hypothetical protein